jgi:hypothetical protein
VGLRDGLDGCGKSRPTPGFDPRTVQPVANRYTDSGIRTTIPHRPPTGLFATATTLSRFQRFQWLSEISFLGIPFTVVFVH